MSANVDAAHKLTDALNAHDAQAIAALLTDDCLFFPAKAGIEVRGRDEVTKSLIAWLDAHQSYKLETVREFFADDSGYNEWRFVATTLGGDPVDVHGVDYFKFVDGKIAEKNSFKKV